MKTSNMLKSRQEAKAAEKVLLNVKELRVYLGLGDTKTRELLNDKRSPFTVRIGNRLYANKKLLDRWLDQISGN